MAAKIAKLLSCSSIVIGRRSVLSTQQTNFTHTFDWIRTGKVKGSPVLSHFTLRMSSTTSEAPAVNVAAKPITSEEPAVADEGTIEPEQGDASNKTATTLERSNEEPSVNSDAPSESVPSTNADPSVQQERKPRVQKIKAAILLSYSGQGYFGMQIQNSGARTIENDLMKAFLDAGVIDQDGFEKPKSIKFQRAARTDKNVSAARNLVSIMVPKTFDVDSVNKFLPDQIRVMDYRRVTKSFDSKIACCARTYLYMIPTFAFTPMEEKVVESYRITPDVLETLRKTLKLYEGTKNHHNFTSRKKPTDPSAIRFIMSFTASEPFVKDGLEYVVLQVKGQSFMLHQIRKMIGLVVAILRGYATEETIKKAFTLDKIDIPMAPGLGLMLGETHYDHYNKKFGRDGIHEPLIWDNVADKIEQFCQEKIYPEVTRTENEEKSMFQWLSTVSYHTFDVRDEHDHRGYGALGKAQLLVDRENGKVEGSEEEDELDEDIDDLPAKRQKLS